MNNIFKYVIKLLKYTIYTLLLLLFALSIYLLSIKILAYRGAVEIYSIWDEDKICYITIYVQKYSPYGIPGEVLRLFSNEAFFVVYHKDGRKLRSSAWYFWQAQSADNVFPEWIGLRVLYPTSDRWSSWDIDECLPKKSTKNVSASTRE